jgi:hypothetical protein
MSSNSRPQANKASGTSSTRSRRAKRFQEWESIKGEVERLYIEEDESLQVTMQEVEEKFGFTSRYGSPVPLHHPAPLLPCHMHYPSKCILKSSVGRGNGR